MATTRKLLEFLLILALTIAVCLGPDVFQASGTAVPHHEGYTHESE